MVRRDGAALQVSGYPARADELCETVVVGLITQRSQVQILPPLLDGLTTTVSVPSSVRVVAWFGACAATVRRNTLDPATVAVSASR